MVLTVCFDVLQTCFSLEPLVDAVEDVLGDELRQARTAARSLVMDWFHAAQRDFTMLSVISAPPPPIAQILRLTLPRAVTYALTSTHPTNVSLSSLDLPDFSKITSTLTRLTPAPALLEAWTRLHEAEAKVILVTNGSEGTTRGYVSNNGLEKLVDRVMSCDDVGHAKPFAQVYQRAQEVCTEEGAREGKDIGDRWFVACHTWDVCAARKNGFKTGLVLSEQPPIGVQDREDQQDKYWRMYGGLPDVVGRDLKEVIDAILATADS